MTASIIAKNTPQSAPGVLQEYALCTEVLVSSLVIRSNNFFFIVLLLPLGLGDSSIEAVTDFCETESKSLRRKWAQKGSIKCIGKADIWYLQTFHCSAKMTVVCYCWVFDMQADRTHALHLYFTPTLCILFFFFPFFFFLDKH